MEGVEGDFDYGESNLTRLRERIAKRKAETYTKPDDTSSTPSSILDGASTFLSTASEYLPSNNPFDELLVGTMKHFTAEKTENPPPTTASSSETDNPTGILDTLWDQLPNNPFADSNDSSSDIDDPAQNNPNFDDDAYLGATSSTRPDSPLAYTPARHCNITPISTSDTANDTNASSTHDSSCSSEVSLPVAPAYKSQAPHTIDLAQVKRHLINKEGKATTFGQALAAGDKDAVALLKEIMRRLGDINAHSEALGYWLRKHQGRRKMLLEEKPKSKNPFDSADSNDEMTIYVQGNQNDFVLDDKKKQKLRGYDQAANTIAIAHGEMTQGINTALTGDERPYSQQLSRAIGAFKGACEQPQMLEPMAEKDYARAGKVGLGIGMLVGAVVALLTFLPLVPGFPQLLSFGMLGTVDLSFVAPTLSYCFGAAALTILSSIGAFSLTSAVLARRKAQQKTRGAIRAMKRVLRENEAALGELLQKAESFAFKQEGDPAKDISTTQMPTFPVSSPIKIIHDTGALYRFDIQATRNAILKSHPINTHKPFQQTEYNRLLNNLDHRLTDFNRRTAALEAELAVWKSHADETAGYAHQIHEAHTRLVVDMQHALEFPTRGDDLSVQKATIFSEITAATKKFESACNTALLGIDVQHNPAYTTVHKNTHKWIAGFGIAAAAIAVAAAFTPLSLFALDNILYWHVLAGGGCLVSGVLGGAVGFFAGEHHHARHGLPGRIHKVVTSLKEGNGDLSNILPDTASLTSPHDR